MPGTIHWLDDEDVLALDDPSSLPTEDERIKEYGKDIPDDDFTGDGEMGEQPFELSEEDLLPDLVGAARAAPLDEPSMALPFVDQVAMERADAPAAALEERGYNVRQSPQGLTYQGPQGDWYLAQPSGVMPMITQMGAGMAAHGPAGIGAGLGAFGGPLGAALGGAGGEWLDRVITGRNQASPDVLVEGAAGGAGELAGRGLGVAGKWMKNRLGVQLSQDEIANARNLYGQAETRGIGMTVPEALGQRGMINLQNTALDIPGAADPVGDFMRRRNPQVAGAIDDYLNTISPQTSPFMAEQQAGAAARGARQALVDQRKAAAAPFYEAADKVQVDSTSAQALVSDLAVQAEKMEGTASGKAYNTAIAALTRKTKDGRAPKTMVEDLHDAKVEIDGMIDSADRAGNSAVVRRLVGVKSDLLDLIETSSSSYQRARTTFAEKSAPINQFDETIVGKQTQKEIPEMKLGGLLFKSSSSSPEQVAIARDAISRQSPEAWPGLMRGHIQNELETIKTSATGENINLAGQFHKKLLGSEKQRQIWQQSMTPDQYARMNALDEVLQAISRTTPTRSPTAGRQEMIAQMKGKADPLRAMVPTPWKIPGRMAQHIRDEKFVDTVGKLADTIIQPMPQTDKELQIMVRTLRSLDPGELGRSTRWQKWQKAAITALATMLGGNIELEGQQ